MVKVVRSPLKFTISRLLLVSFRRCFNMFSLSTCATPSCIYGASFATLRGGSHTIDKKAGWTNRLSKNTYKF